jgi:hypothetical protein
MGEDLIRIKSDWGWELGRVGCVRGCVKSLCGMRRRVQSRWRERWSGALEESVQVGIKRKGQEWTEEMETRCARERVESRWGGVGFCLCGDVNTSK